MKPDSTIYRGRRLPEEGQRPDTACELLVQCDGRALDARPSQRLRNHSPDGFNWGYAGSGPAQLALAILLDFTGDQDLAAHHYQDFKFAMIATLPQEADWQITGTQIRAWLTGAEHTRPMPTEATLSMSDVEDGDA